MRRWRRALALLVALATLSGCLGGAGGEADAAPITSDDAGGNTSFVAPEGRGRIVAFEETNVTEEGAGGVDHHHDYWAGRERVRLHESEVSLGVDAMEGSTHVFKPAMGNLVFEGTESVEATVSAPMRGPFDDATGSPAPMLSYKHAATSDWIDAGQMSWGESLVIRIADPAHTDMPHASWSLWAFRLTMPSGFVGPLSFHVGIDILRGDGDIPLWPGHPVFYADTHSRIVLDTDASAYENGFASNAAPVETQDGGPVSPEKVISYGTRTVHVFVNITRFDVTNPLDEPTNFFLWYHNASGVRNATNIFDATNHSADLMEHKWTIRVDDAGMDSPYADGSRWAFELGAAFMQGVPGVMRVSCYGGCATWSGDYHITVIATDQVLPDEAYDEW